MNKCEKVRIIRNLIISKWGKQKKYIIELPYKPFEKYFNFPKSVNKNNYFQLFWDKRNIVYFVFQFRNKIYRCDNLSLYPTSPIDLIYKFIMNGNYWKGENNDTFKR